MVLFFFGNVVSKSTKLRLQNILEIVKKMSNALLMTLQQIRARRELVVTRWICKFKYRRKQVFFETIWRLFFKSLKYLVTMTQKDTKKVNKAQIRT